MHSQTSTAQPLKFGVDKWFRLAFALTCDYLSMLGFKLTDFNKKNANRAVYPASKLHSILYSCHILCNENLRWNGSSFSIVCIIDIPQLSLYLLRYTVKSLI